MVQRKRYKKNASATQLSSLVSGTLPPQVINRMRFEKVKREWPGIVGQKLASKSCLTSMENGRLFICASSPPAAQHIQMKSRAIISVLQKVWGLDIKSVKVFVGNVRRSYEQSSPERSDRRIHVDPREVSIEKDRISRIIDDPKLAESLASLKVICRKKFGVNRSKAQK